jgi:hypothetical protein
MAGPENPQEVDGAPNYHSQLHLLQANSGHTSMQILPVSQIYHLLYMEGTLVTARKL